MNLKVYKKRFPVITNITIIGSLLFLAACGVGGYRDIKPTYNVNNSPIPVPYPRMKPNSKNSNLPTPELLGQIYAGQIVIRRGDTIYGISKREGVEMKALISENNLKPPYKLTPGNQIKQGETGYSISRQYGFDLTTLIKMNNLKKPFVLKVGQKLKLSGDANQVKINVTSKPKPQPATVRRVEAKTINLPKPSSIFSGMAMPPRESSRFLWPASGNVISPFGPKSGGLHNDGINIGAKPGEGVRAAEAGIVAYAGSGIRGFGNLLLIRHSGGWVTAYAHNDKLLVSKGELVSRGQPIANAGQSGNVDSPQVHFEIRKGKVAVNPVQYLVRSRS